VKSYTTESRDLASQLKGQNCLKLLCDKGRNERSPASVIAVSAQIQRTQIVLFQKAAK
jgi:hypothetical protein